MTVPSRAATSAPLRVLLGDGRPLLRDGLARLLAAQHGVLVVAQAGDCSEVLDAATAAAPDVAMLDAHLPGGALDAVRALRARFPDAEVLLYGLPEDDAQFISALRAGVKGFADREADIEYLAASIRRVAAGEVTVSPRLARHITAWAAPLVAATQQSRRLSNELKQREIEVLQLVAAGHSNRDAAAALGLSEHTVRAHLRAVARKLGARNRVQAVSEAIRYGLVSGAPAAAGRGDGEPSKRAPRAGGAAARGAQGAPPAGGHGLPAPAGDRRG